jgi:uncharacterized protein (DUF1778 family)
MKMSPRDTQINVRISAQVKRLAEEAAEADSRSMSSFIEKLIMDHLREHGHLPDSGKPAGKRK